MLAYMLPKFAVDHNGGRYLPELDGGRVNRLEFDWFLLLDEMLEITDFLPVFNLDDKGVLVAIPEDPALELECAIHDEGGRVGTGS